MKTLKIGSPLGKGLRALLPVSEETGFGLDGVELERPDSPYFLCPISFIVPNPYQPRKEFDQDELESLAASIREKGVLQPLVVRKIKDNEFELVAGERRLRAAGLAELEKVPVLIRDIALSDRLEVALIENIQREDLNALEEAEAYAKLADEFSMTQETIAKRVGKKRSTVANFLRILALPEYAKDSLRKGAISAGHARVLLGLESEDEMRAMHDEIVKKQLSVRDAEQLSKSIKNRSAEQRTPGAQRKAVPGVPISYCKSLNNSLGAYLGAKSKIMQSGSRGKIEIEYYSPDDLERLLALIIKEG